MLFLEEELRLSPTSERELLILVTLDICFLRKILWNKTMSRKFFQKNRNDANFD